MLGALHTFHSLSPTIIPRGNHGDCTQVTDEERQSDMAKVTQLVRGRVLVQTHRCPCSRDGAETWKHAERQDEGPYKTCQGCREASGVSERWTRCAAHAPGSGRFGFLGSALGEGLNARNSGTSRGQVLGRPRLRGGQTLKGAGGRGTWRRGPAVGHYLAEGLVSPEATVSGPNPSGGKEQEGGKWGHQRQ